MHHPKNKYMLRVIELIFYISYKYTELTFKSNSKMNVYKLSTLDAAFYSFDGLLLFFFISFELVTAVFLNLNMTQEVLLFLILYIVVYVLCHWYLRRNGRCEAIICEFDKRFNLKKWHIVFSMFFMLMFGLMLSFFIFLWRYKLGSAGK